MRPLFVKRHETWTQSWVLTRLEGYFVGFGLEVMILFAKSYTSYQPSGLESEVKSELKHITPTLRWAKAKGKKGLARKANDPMHAREKCPKGTKKASFPK